MAAWLASARSLPEAAAQAITRLACRLRHHAARLVSLGERDAPR